MIFIDPLPHVHVCTIVSQLMMQHVQISLFHVYNNYCVQITLGTELSHSSWIFGGINLATLTLSTSICQQEAAVY